MARTLLRGSTQIMEESVFNDQVAYKDAGSGYTGIELVKIEDSEFIVLANGTPVAGNIDMGGHKITNVGPGVDPSDVVIKSQLDSISAGLDPKESVRVATTGDITLSGLQTIDGVALQVGDRVLVKDQTDPTENGIYIASSTGWTRSEDADGVGQVGEVSGGMFTFVETGSTNAGSGWVVVADGTLVPDTDTITFTQFAGGGAMTGGLGINVNGTEIVADTDNSSIINTAGGGNKIGINALGVLSGHLANDSVITSKVLDANITAIKVNADIAGDALTKNATSNALDVNVDGTTISIVGNQLQANASALTSAMAGDGLIRNAGSGELDVNVDGTTIEITGDTLRVVAGGIGTSHLADDSVTREKINADIAGLGIVQAAGGELDVNVDGTTIEIAADVVGVKAAGITEVEIASSALGTGLTGGSGTVIAVDTSVMLAASNYVVREPHNATTDGQTVVTLVNTPAAGTEMVFVNGVLMEEGASNDYTISGATVTFTFGLQYHATNTSKRDKVAITYFKA